MTAWPWTRIEIFICIVIFISMLRWPPKKPSGIQDLVERHWGDWIGILLVSLGVCVTLFACLSTTLNANNLPLVVSLGSQLLAGGFLALKLKTTPGANGGNGTPVSTQVTHTESVTEAKVVTPVVPAAKPIAPVGYYDADVPGSRPVGKPARFDGTKWTDTTTGATISP